MAKFYERKITDLQKFKEKLLVWSWIKTVLLCIIIGLFLFFAKSPIAVFLANITRSDPIIWEIFLQEFSIGLIIAALIAVLLERVVHELILGRITATLEPFSSLPNVLIGSKEFGVEDIFGRRYYDSKYRAEKQIYKSIKRQIDKKDGEIKVLCVAAPDLFNLGSEVSRLIVDKLSDITNKCKLKILFLDQNSDWAKFRANLEIPHPTLSHIDQLLLYLNNLKQDPELNGKIEYRQYDAPPIVFLIITDEFVIYEPYPIIKVDRNTAPIGGWIPMLMAKSSTETYHRWQKHFDYLWGISDPKNQKRSYF